MANIYDQLAKLSPEQRALFEQRLRDKGMAVPVANRILPRQSDDALPLSYAQQRLWFVQQYDPANTAYNISTALRILGDLDYSKLTCALQGIIARHESLRTSFAKDANGEARQLIHPPEALEIPIHDVSEESEIEASARQRIVALSSEPFDLTEPPLRFEILRLGIDDSVLALATHHIICDRWSVMIFVRELAQWYADEGKNHGLLPIQYPDWALWQRDQLKGDLASKQLVYWRERLDGILPQLDLPTRSGSIPSSHRGEHLPLVLHQELSEQLKELANQRQVSLFTVLLAGFKALLHRYTGETDIVVGSEVANRDQPETAGLIGLLVNTLVFRSDLSGELTYLALIQRVQETVQGGLINQDLPFEKLVETLNPDRNLEQLTPLFQVKFDLQQVSVGELDLGELRLEHFPIEETQTKYDLRFNLQESKDGIRGQIEFSTDLFSLSTMARMAEHFITLLEAIASDPNQPIDDLPLLSKAEHADLLEKCQGRQRCRSESTLHGLFETRAIDTPDAIAIYDGVARVSYRELQRRTEDYAEQLRSIGITSGDRVGVCLPKSSDLIAVLFGVLKASAAYVPLDPRYPEERLRYIIDDAQCSAVFKEDSGKVVLADHSKNDTVAKPESTTAEALAYIIYTSGSTGQPKGVAINHRAATTMVRWARDHYSNEELAGVLASTSICFDLSIFEIFVPLAYGGAVILTDNLLVIGKLPARDKVTLLNTVPSLMRKLVNADELPSTVLTINLAGEALPVDLVADLQDRKVSRIYNLYGPSEDTTYSTWTALHAECFDPDNDPMTIGKPIDNTFAYVLDAKKRLQPVGVAGELYLGGDGLALGYLGNSELTASSFLTNPIVSKPPRLYRTGDRVRLLEDGKLEFLGRVDHQFKIRGFRIEAGEIETVLRSHVDVEDALVVSHWEENEAVLLAYVVPAESGAFQAQELRTHLSERLPSAMVPSLWQVLVNMPRLPNGKVDRSQLPRPDQQTSSVPYTEPETETERRLVLIWESLLRKGRVGIHDTFFELGGHSLLAIQLVTNVEAEFGQIVPLRTLFLMPTVAQLAQFLDESQHDASGATPSSSQIQPDPKARHKPFPLTDIQQAYWLGRSGAFELGNMATHGYREIDIKAIPHQAIEVAFNKLICQHDMLRMVIGDDGRQRTLAEVPDYKIALDTGPNIGDEKRCAARRKALSHQVFATDTWPLFHVEAVARSNDVVRYFVSFDVLLGDAWSLQILGREMAQVLMGSALPRLSLSFRDYVLAERSLAESDNSAKAWQFWQEQIPKLPPAPDLPLVKSPREIENPRATRRSMRLSASHWKQFQRKAQALGLTASAAVLSAFAEVLATWSRKQEFTINLTLFNRRPVHPEIDSIVGDFTSSTLLGCVQRPDRAFSQQALSLQTKLWEALEHRAVSGVRVIRELARQRQSGGQAIMPVVFTSTLGKMSVSSRTGDLDAEVVYGLSQTSQVYLDHQVSEIDGELILNWDCLDELWPAGVLDTMFETYGDFLRVLAANEGSWDIVPRLSDRRHFEELNAPAQNIILSEGKAPVLLHTLFFERASNHPSSPAVITDDATLSYAELAKRVTALAGILTKRDVRPNELVAVSMPKGWEQVVACLGILAAGAAYVPINPTLPSARRQQLITDTEARLVLTTSASPNDWPNTIEPLLVDDSLEQNSDMCPESPQLETDLAYVIYTSGSTGMPKGVMVDHRGAVNTILDINGRINLGSDDRVFALSSLSFDLSVYDILGTLAGGAAIVIGTDAIRSEDPAYWQQLVERHQVTIWNSVPALAQLLVEQCENRPTALRVFLLSGDWIPLRLPEAIAKHFPEAYTYSLGGATEASIWSIIHPINSIDPSWPSIPYGLPLANQKWYVLDERLNACPPWVPGELYIGGIGLAKGYWKQPSLTAKQFIPNPFAPEDSGERLYRTGDWGRLRGSELEFLGREDLQVKINGYRIELGEVEAILQRHPAIDQAVVTTFGSPPELFAYVVPNHQDTKIASKRPSNLDKITLGIELPRVVKPSFRRQSHRQFLETAVPMHSLANLLSNLQALPIESAPFPKVRYPSAGSHHPVEVFVDIKADRVEGIAAGWYRYASRAHRLIPIEAEDDFNKVHLFDINRKIYEQSAFTFFLIADLDRIKPTYGDRSRDFCLLEAGYIGQLLMECAPDQDLGLCPANERGFESLPRELGLTSTHICLHALLGGAIEPHWSERWMALYQRDDQSLQQRLETQLQEELPAYMVPRRFQILDTLPLSANGKVDRNALPLPQATGISNYVAPRTDLENTIVGLWQDLLDIDQVGIRDDFFQLGGNSLQAIQLLGQLRKACHPALTMEHLFGALTPAAQAELIDTLELAVQEDSITRVARGEDPLDIGQLSDEEVEKQLNKLLDS